MNTRYSDDVHPWIERGRDLGLTAWEFAVAAWRRNPGYAVAALSGSLGLLLAIWLLLAAFFSWLTVPRPRLESTYRPPQPTALERAVRQQLARTPQDELDLPLQVDLQVRPAVTATAVVRPRITGRPIEPEFALTMPAPPQRLAPEVVEAVADDDLYDEEPKLVSRFNRATSSGESRFADDEPLLTADDEPEPPAFEPVPEREPEPEPDWRLAGGALDPEFADDTALAWLLPAPAEDEPEPRIVAIPEEEEEPVPEPAGWKGAAQLPPRETAKVTEESPHVETKVVSPEPPPPPVVTRVEAPPPPVRAPKLALRWEPHDAVTPGKLQTLILIVSNVGDAPAPDVRLDLRLPGGVDHPEGHELEQAIGKLNPGDSQRIPLIVRPEQPGEMQLPVTARTGKHSTQSTGRLQVGDSRRSSVVDRGCDTGPADAE